MRHLVHRSSFGRKPAPRKALFRNLVVSLVEHERIRTTAAKAKVLRQSVERAITIGKAGNLAARRLLLSRYPNPSTVAKIVDQLSPRFSERPGGYTRIIKLGARPGDKADMAYIEFVDYVAKAQDAENTDTNKSAATEAALKISAKAKAARRSVKRKLESKARKVSFKKAKA